MLTRLAFGLGALLLLSTGILGSMANAQAGPGDPEAVITSYEMARNRRDIDAALSYFADDATIVQRSATFTGKDEIRKFLEGSAGRGRFVVVSDRHTVGNQVTWTERSAGGGFGTQAQVQGLSGFQVTVEAFVQDGKIRTLSYSAFGQTPQAPIVVDSHGQVPAAFGLASVMALLLGVVLLASTGVGRAVGAPSRLRGTLLHDLRGWAAARQ